MDITFDYTAVFFLKSWRVDGSKKGFFYLSLFLVFCFSLLTRLPFFYDSRDRKSLLLKVLAKFLLYALSFITMFLLMTCNGWVILSVILGNFLGCVLFLESHKKQSPLELAECLCC